MRDDQINDIISSILVDRMKDDKHTADRIGETLIMDVILSVTEVFQREDFMLSIKGNFVVIGDIHGNIGDLIRIFESEGYPPKTSYILLGDYVDRGNYSLEVILLLYLLKLKFPQNIYLLRGNHESSSVTKIYGFRDDCVYRLNNYIYRRFIKSFGKMPILALVNDEFLCVHGGISPKILNISEFNDYLKQTKVTGEIADLLWSDPSQNIKGFCLSERKLGHKFGYQALSRFLAHNNLKMLIRGHSYCETGYKYDFGVDGGCLTVFSSCNYAGKSNNAAIALINQFEVTVKAFESVKECNCSARRVCLPDWIIESSQNTPEHRSDYEEVDEQLLPFNITYSLIE